MRRKAKNKNIVEPDLKYSDFNVAKLINYIMKGGHKMIAQKIVYDAFSNIQEKKKVENPIEIFREALNNLSPRFEIKSRRVGGANYQVPQEVRPERKLFLALKWLIESARKNKGKTMAEKLAEEIILAASNEGSAMKMKNNLQRMADANKAFAHLAKFSSR